MAIHETLNAMSAGIVLAEASDSEALSRVEAQLGEVVEWATEQSRADLSEIAAAAASLLREILHDDIKEPDAALERVGQAITSLQHAFADDGRVPADDGPDIGSLEDDSILADFLSDQEGAMDEMEALILALEDDPDGSHLTKIKGGIHTLKGEAGVLALVDVAELCHSIEDVIEARTLAEIPGILLEAIDWLRRRFAACEAGTAAPPPMELPTESTPRDGANATSETPAAEPALEQGPWESRDEPATAADDSDLSAFGEPATLTGDPEITGEFVAEAREHLEEVDDRLLALEKNAADSEAIDSIFRAFHTIKGVASFLELVWVQLLAHEAETMLDMVRNGELELVGEHLTITFEVNDTLKRLLGGIEDALASGECLNPDPGIQTLMQKLKIVTAGGTLPAAPRVDGNVTIPTSDKPAKEPAKPPASTTKPVAATNKKVQVRETIKVDAHRLDELVDAIGELVIAEAMVSQSEELQIEGATHLPGLLTRMDKITRELQEMAMSMRMVPIRSTFRRMARLARDVAEKVGKKIEFVTTGDDTELDKTVVDSIGDPLVHMVRNAVDHGIEDGVEARRSVGKPDAGRIQLRAFHQGGSIHIEIEDDGGGLDAQRILAKARDRGIVAEGENLTDSEIYPLIFAPGFSTAKTVTDVSGRGVGLDVVKRSIEGLRGSVEIRSNLGKGSVFSIRLPLTLAIIDGMVVRVGRERYILPTVSIVRMLRPNGKDLSRVFDSGTLLKTGDGMVPLFRIHEIFDIPDAIQDLEHASAVIVEHGGRQCALVVDQLIGQQQIVIKPLGPALAGTPGLAGGAIMPDGQVGLILDIASLLQITTSASAPT